MILIQLLTLLMFSAGLAWWLESRAANSARWLALFSLCFAVLYFTGQVFSSDASFAEFVPMVRLPWIARFHIDFALALDHLSILLVLLTLLLGIIAVLVSWREISERVGFYYFNLLFTIAGIIGVFTSSDMFLFFFFWEVMLLPMTALIAIWGHEQRYFAAIKFFIFTQISGLLMLVAIIVMAYWYAQQFGELSFSYQDWRQMKLPADQSWYLMLGFFIAFAVKLPSVPVHGWLPDAHTQAPTAGSVLLAGVLLKTGAYGLIRFVILLFPEASQAFAPAAMVLAVVSILYGAKMAFAQQDFKRLVAYSSISHMGFVMLALFSFSAIAYQGAIMTMVAHGLSSAALFAMAGIIYSRIHSRNLADMGGFWRSAPRMGGFVLAFAAAAFGLPGLANFIGEFMSLLGAFATHPLAVCLAALAMIASAVYGMAMFQNSFHGPSRQQVADLLPRELLVTGSLLLFLLLLGLAPQFLLSSFAQPRHLAQQTAVSEPVPAQSGGAQ